MPYDLIAAREDLMKAMQPDGWKDKKSEALEKEYLLPLLSLTAGAQTLAEEIDTFILDVENKLEEIMSGG